MTTKTFQRLALLFLAANEKFSAASDWVWEDTLKKKVSAITSLAKELRLLDDEPDKPP